MLSIRTALSLFLLMLMGTLFIVHAEAQEATPSAHILWQKELDSNVLQKWHIGLEKPDVGISTDTTRAFPIRMAATIGALYLFDSQGNVERRIPLDKQFRQVEQDSTFSEYATTAPNGQFYAIRTLLARDIHGPFTHLRVFKADGTFLFELNEGEWTDDDKRPDGSPKWRSLWGTPFIAPNGEYMVVFHHGGGWIGPEEGTEPAFLNFYDMTGTLIKHISEKDFRQYDFFPERLGFSKDGSHVMLMGLNTKIQERDAEGYPIRQMDLMVFDAQGKKIRRIEGYQTKNLTVARNPIKRLIDSERYDVLGIAEFRMLGDGKRGVYNNGKTLYLFELDNATDLVSTFYREFEKLHSD